MSDSKFASYTERIEGLFRAGDSNSSEKRAEAANIQLIQELTTAIGRNDLSAVGGMLAEDIKFEILGADEFPFIRVAHGREHVLEAIKQNFGALQDQRPTIEAVIAQGDTVMVVLTEEGIIRATGRAYRLKGTQRFVIRAGKVELVEDLVVMVPPVC
jgi:ketosteroid isomerase-like protein